jgi:hypothetical protein
MTKFLCLHRWIVVFFFVSTQNEPLDTLLQKIFRSSQNHCYSWGGTADSFEMAKLSKLVGKACTNLIRIMCLSSFRLKLCVCVCVGVDFPCAEFDVPHEEFAAFLKSNGHPQEIIDMMKDFPHKTYERLRICGVQ